jgi:hypothetical protein
MKATKVHRVAAVLGVLVLGSLVGAVGAGPALAQPAPTPPPNCIPHLPGTPCQVKTTVSFTHVTTHDVWAVGNFPNRTEVHTDVAYTIDCANGAHVTVHLDTFILAPNWFGALGADNGALILPATSGRSVSVQCTMSQVILAGWSTTAVAGSVPGGNVVDDYARFDNV